jgi:hypothetical protein
MIAVPTTLRTDAIHLTRYGPVLVLRPGEHFIEFGEPFVVATDPKEGGNIP